MLKHIHPLISADLVKVMMDMGHGDEIVFADRNFPAASHTRLLLRYPGIEIQPLLHAVLTHFPVDYAVPEPVVMMRIPADADCDDATQQAYRRILAEHTGGEVGVELLARHDFYDRASRAFAVVATGETARFANIIIKKGIIR